MGIKRVKEGKGNSNLPEFINEGLRKFLPSTVCDRTGKVPSSLNNHYNEYAVFSFYNIFNSLLH